MIKPSEIKAKSRKKYTAFLKAWLADEPFFPLRIPAKMASSRTDWDSLRTWQRSLIAASKQAVGYGYTVVLGPPTRTRSHGTQSLPEKIVFDTQDDFLRYHDKQAEFQQFIEDVALIRQVYPQLESWLQARPESVIQYAGQWPDLLKVCAYFLQHPNPNLYLRELPIAVHSKFIEQHKDILRRLLNVLLPDEGILANATDFESRFGVKKAPITVRFRILDPALVTELGLPSDDLSLPMEDFGRLPFRDVQVVISENLMPFLTLPAMVRGIGIFGEGNAVASLHAPWLEDASILYWGDLDQQGFRFLAQVRQRYPQVASVFMDQETLRRYEAFVVTGVEDRASDPEGLTPAEEAAYDVVKANTFRLEQERILHEEVFSTIATGLNPSQ